uniref:CUT domain-containing protein n=1 Tax=Strongyloides stercoralis TaxID=6248 RepID=A0A0K0E0C1_STRER
MEFQIKYISTGDVSNVNEMSRYHDPEVWEEEGTLFNDLRPFNTFPEHQIKNNNIESYQKSYFEPHHSMVYTMNRKAKHSPFFMERKNYLYTPESRRIVNRSIRRNYTNSKQRPIHEQIYQSNINFDPSKQHSFNKTFITHKSSNLPLVGGKSITRCCCCGRNRIYQNENIPQQQPFSRYNMPIVKKNCTPKMGKESSSQERKDFSKQCYVKTDVLKKQKIIQYNGEGVVSSNESLKLCSVRKISQEQLYKEYKDNKNKNYFDKPPSINVRRYSLIDKQKNTLGNHSLPSNISPYPNSVERNDNRKLNEYDSSYFLLDEEGSNLPLSSPVHLNNTFNEVYPPISREEENDNSFFFQYQDSILASLIKESDTSKEDDSMFNELPNIDTQELCRFVTNELRRYSISQSTFAKKVLNRSQGTLSDILRKPKPWNKLRTGKDTFVKMYEWSLLPESERFRILSDNDNFMI